MRALILAAIAVFAYSTPSLAGDKCPEGKICVTFDEVSPLVAVKRMFLVEKPFNDDNSKVEIIEIDGVEFVPANVPIVIG